METKKSNSMNYDDWNDALSLVDDPKVRRLLEDEAAHLDADELERRFRLLADLTSTGDLQDSNFLMIDHFMSGNNGAAGAVKPDFPDSEGTLATAAFDNSTFKKFIEGIKAVLRKKLQSGEFSEINISSHDPGTPELSFGVLSYLTGLTFALHKVNEYSVKVSNIVCDRENHSYKANLTVALEDDFGLDSDDIVEFGTGARVWGKSYPAIVMPFAAGTAVGLGSLAFFLDKQAQESKNGIGKSLYKGLSIASGVVSGLALVALSTYTVVIPPLAVMAAAGFRAWFILQHYYGCRPFKSKLEKTFTDIEGRISKGK